jgi:hypothetical protein
LISSKNVGVDYRKGKVPSEGPQMNGFGVPANVVVSTSTAKKSPQSDGSFSAAGAADNVPEAVTVELKFLKAKARKETIMADNEALIQIDRLEGRGERLLAEPNPTESRKRQAQMLPAKTDKLSLQVTKIASDSED